MPTVLDWMGVPYPAYSIFRRLGEVSLTGRSLISDLLQPASKHQQQTVSSTYRGITELVQNFCL